MARVEDKFLWTFASASLLACTGCSLGAGSADAGRDVSLIAPPLPDGGVWTTTTVSENAGLHLAMEGRGDDVDLAWYRPQARIGDTCVIGDTGTTRERRHFAIELATGDGSGTYRVEEVGEVLALDEPLGLDLAHTPSGDPLVAAAHGPEEERIFYCGSNDAGYFRRDGASFTAVTVATQSNQAPTGNAASDFGYVVGLWPAIGVTISGRVVLAWRDTHRGGAQSDDEGRADLEIAWGTEGSFAPYALDWGAGAGTFTDLAVDPMGRANLVYINPTELTLDSRNGLWVARGSEDGETYEKLRLSEDTRSAGPSIAIDHEGQPVVAWFDGRPRFARLTREGRFDDPAAWMVHELGDAAFDEGYDPDIAVAPDGTVAMVYYRCSDIRTPGVCDDELDGVIFAQRQADGRFTTELVDGGGDGAFCGNYPQIAWTNGGWVVGYQCQVTRGSDRRLVVRVARQG